MNPTASLPDEPQGAIALYWDFENLHASLCEARQGEGSYHKPDARFRLQEPLIDVQAVVDLAHALGPIAVHRAYCNWQFFGRYRDVLLQNAIELIQLFPPGASAKNGADIRLCLDAMEDLGRQPHVGTVMVVGGDSDFMPLAQKVKAAGRRLVGVGSRRTTNRHWARSCHEFRYYESLVEEAPPGPADASGVREEPLPGGPAAELVRRALRVLALRSGEPWAEPSAVERMVRRLDGSFDVREHGSDTFDALLAGLAGGLAWRDGPSGRELRWR
ncbi:NYN domain-containing protein [Eleftheria terrae]|uniref:NYN domain-containing protein n=1 Tax=Eleftheria terrae TaxID=1597781 RepID=UPI00263B1E07|nr:NYN domain-containing protein [Eleftheria terrae]WKB53565.1 NYN domain-containing protein [Eleftheria terrae]